MREPQSVCTDDLRILEPLLHNPKLKLVKDRSEQ